MAEQNTVTEAEKAGQEGGTAAEPEASGSGVSRPAETVLAENPGRFKRRALIAAAGALVIVCGLFCSLFYSWRQDSRTRESELERLTAQLTEARQELEELKEKNEQLSEEAEVAEAIAEKVGEAEKELLEIPFEVDLTDWRYLLVNEKNPLKPEYEPELVKTRDGERIDARIKDALEEMIDAAKADGMNLLICSGYRDYQKQASLLEQGIRRRMRNGLSYQEAFFSARKQIAPVGASEHHTGLAADIVGRSHQTLDRSQADTKEAKWLCEHAREYGFILRYPEDKAEKTMITFESWHFRYVGKEAAVFMEENHLCLEEFVELAQAWEKLKAEEMAWK